MNKHLCRGKRLDNGDWVTGFYINMRHNDQRTHIHHFIIPLDSDMSYGALLENVLVEVDPATVGRCTGVVAAKSYRGDAEADRLIWEGDILRIFEGSTSEVIGILDWCQHDQAMLYSKTLMPMSIFLILVILIVRNMLKSSPPYTTKGVRNERD